MWNIPGARPLASALALALALAAASSCGGDQTQVRDSDAESSNVKRGVKPEPDAEAAVIEVESAGVPYGRIVIELYPNVAPEHVERFKTLAREGFYNGTAFHRVERNVIQGGDPLSKDDDPSNDGSGGSDYPDLPAEFSDIPYDAGVVGAARTSDPNSANCQFFITLARTPQWDDKYTVFGRVVEGLTQARVISGAPTRPGTTNPDPKIVMRGVTLQPRANFK
ncbi:MAG TPA: peptidylprolyl isomerase [Pyrinomonadaceae bacterium]|nr:peptidylprolyl isomerase [Pyrinomonadaceae bacterium]